MSPGSAANGARASGTKRFDLAAPLRSFSALKHVDGRDKPGHDGSESRAFTCQKTESVLCICLLRTDTRRLEAFRSKMEKKDERPDLLAGARDGWEFLFESRVTH
jgi:hypothetical protein